MTVRLEGNALALVNDQKYAVVSTLRKDATIHSVVAWVGVDDAGRLLLSSVEGRAWLANIRRTGQATVTVVNLDSPGEYVAVTTDLASATHDDAIEVIHVLANKAIGTDFPFLNDDEQRVAVRLQPTRISYQRFG